MTSKNRFGYAISSLLEEKESPQEEAGIKEEVQSGAVVMSEPTSQKKLVSQRKKKISVPSEAEKVENVLKTKEVLTSEDEVKSENKEESEVFVNSEIAQPAVTLNVSNLQGFLQPPQQRGKRDTEGTGRMAIPREQTTLRLRPELKRAVAAAAALEGMTFGDLVEQALVEYLSK